jgi:hypothetical protein
MITAEIAEDLRRELERYLDAQAASTRAQDARAALPPGSTRARVTSANARWAQLAEGRDRLKEHIEQRLVELVRPAAVASIRSAVEALADHDPDRAREGAEHALKGALVALGIPEGR